MCLTQEAKRAFVTSFLYKQKLVCGVSRDLKLCLYCSTSAVFLSAL